MKVYGQAVEVVDALSIFVDRSSMLAEDWKLGVGRLVCVEFGVIGRKLVLTFEEDELVLVDGCRYE